MNHATLRRLEGHSTMRYAGILGVGTFALFAVAACGSGAQDRTFDDSQPAGTATLPTQPPGGNLGSSSGSSGSPAGGTCAAEVTSATRAEVDVIVVIDTSGSMDEETNQVKQNINTFASTIGGSGLDAHVIMIAEKPLPLPVPPGFPIPGICVPQPLAGANCADNPPVFHQINTAVGSNDSLQIILDNYGTYAPWLRPSAYKVFIEVTDDNSTSKTWQQFDTELLAKSAAQFGDTTKRRYIFDSICGWKRTTPVLDAQKCGSAVNTGDQYQNLSQLTGGIVDSVCETDYSSVFNNIAKGLVTKLGCEFAVPKSTTGAQTDPGSVVVNYTPGGGAVQALTRVTDASKCGSIADAWYYDDNTSPTKIIFCPTTCNTAGADTSGKLEIALGCEAPPPK
jgi:hypothetical protein